MTTSGHPDWVPQASLPTAGLFTGSANLTVANTPVTVLSLDASGWVAVDVLASQTPGRDLELLVNWRDTAGNLLVQRRIAHWDTINTLQVSVPVVAPRCEIVAQAFAVPTTVTVNAMLRSTPWVGFGALPPRSRAVGGANVPTGTTQFVSFLTDAGTLTISVFVYDAASAKAEWKLQDLDGTVLARAGFAGGANASVVQVPVYAGRLFLALTNNSGATREFRYHVGWGP
jgi:hypothetical protein